MVVVLTSANALRALDPQKQIGQYGHDSWTSQRGLPGEAVYQILQTSDGYLWIRTGSGLARFDGVRFVSMDAELGSDPVKAIAMGADGDLLIRTASRTVIYKNKQFSDYLPPTPLPDGAIRTLFESREHVVFVGSDDFVYRLDRNGPRLLRRGTGWINAFLEDHTGKIWIEGWSTLYSYGVGGLEQTFDTAATGSTTTSLMEDHLHRLWAGTSTGLYRLDRYQSSLKPVAQPGIPFHVNAVLEDRQGNIWAGTRTSGVARLASGNVAFIDSVGTLTDNNVLSLLEDREGSIWIGTASGLDRLRNTKLTTFTVREGLPSNKVKSAIVTADGTLAVFCENGGLARIKDDIVTVLPHHAQPSSLSGGSLFESRDGSLWIGTAPGLSRLKDGKLTVYGGDGHFSQHFISAITEDDESLIITNSESRAYRFKDGRVLPFTMRGKVTPFTTPGIYTFTMYYDRSGTLWFGTAMGLYKLVPGEALESARESRISFPVTSIFDDHHGSLWLGGRTPGLVQYRTSDRRVTHYTKHDGLFDRYLSRVLQDDDGNLWMSTEDGIYVASQKDLEDFAAGRTKFVSSRSYGLADGLKTTETSDITSQPGGWRTPDGRLWFTTMKGIVVANPRHIFHNDLVPPVMIETVVTDGILQPSGSDLKISPGMSDIEFHFTATSLRVPERVRFKYQLEGYDHDWVDAGSRRVAYYTNLRPRGYRFRVIAANDDGVWNQEGASVKIVLEPLFYQTGWFYSVCGMLLFVTAIAANRRNTRMIRARAEHLSKIVDERTADLRESQRELEQLAHYDTLTSLPNRRMFREDFRRMLSVTRDQGNQFSLLLIDFDRFKQINDTFGHDAGDAFLIEASTRLQAAIRSSDCVARLGGDEFAILLAGDHDEAGIETVCNRIVHSFADAVRFKSANIMTSASVGVAMFPGDGETQEELYKSADIALYEAKRMGRNSWHWYSAETQDESLREPQLSAVGSRSSSL